MQRRHMFKIFSAFLAGGALPAASALAAPPFPLKKTEAEWRAIVSPAAYHVLFEHGTERAGTSPLDNEKRPGTFICAACNQPLFDAAHKYDSGTGWPSFWQPLPNAMGTSTDFKLIYPRTEYHCDHCGGHQGHIQRRPQAHRQALLQQRRGAGLCAQRRGAASATNLTRPHLRPEK